MGLLEGWLTGYGDRRREIEQENLRQAENAMAREHEVFKLLLNSPDDEVRTMAATGLITGSQPQKPKGGLRGWFGEMESNPVYPQLLRYLKTPKITGYEEKISSTLPATFRSPTAALTTQALPQAPPQQAPGVGPDFEAYPRAALPETQTTTPGAPGPAVTQPIPTPRPAPATPVPGADRLAQAQTAFNDVPPDVATPEGQAGLTGLGLPWGPPPTPPPGVAQ